MDSARRNTLQALAAAVLAVPTAGCGAFGSTSRGVTDVVIENRTDATAPVSIIAIEATGATAIDETLTLDAGEQTTINNEVVMQTDSTVEVQVEDGPGGTYDWADAHDSLHVTITDDDIEFEEKP